MVRDSLYVCMYVCIWRNMTKKYFGHLISILQRDWLRNGPKKTQKNNFVIIFFVNSRLSHVGFHLHNFRLASRNFMGLDLSPESCLKKSWRKHCQLNVDLFKCILPHWFRITNPIQTFLIGNCSFIFPREMYSFACRVKVFLGTINALLPSRAVVIWYTVFYMCIQCLKRWPIF